MTFDLISPNQGCPPSCSSGQDGRISTKLMVVSLLNKHISESNTWWQSGRRVSDAGPTCCRTAAVSSQANDSTLVTFSVLHPSFPVLCRLPSALKRDLSLADRVFRRSALSSCCRECCGRVCVCLKSRSRSRANRNQRCSKTEIHSSTSGHPCFPFTSLPAVSLGYFQY